MKEINNDSEDIISGAQITPEKRGIHSISEEGWTFLGTLTSHAGDLKEFLDRPYIEEYAFGKQVIELDNELTKSLRNKDSLEARECAFRLLNIYASKLEADLDDDDFLKGMMEDHYGMESDMGFGPGSKDFDQKRRTLRGVRDEINAEKERIAAEGSPQKERPLRKFRLK